MPGIIEYPTVVEQALKEFGEEFANEPERRHFAEYLTGLLVCSVPCDYLPIRSYAWLRAMQELGAWEREVSNLRGPLHGVFLVDDHIECVILELL